MNFKKLICVLSSLTISLGSFATYNNVKGAEFNLDDVYKNIYIPNGKKNCCWASSGVSYLKYIFSKFFGEVKDSPTLGINFINTYGSTSFKEDRLGDIYRELWAIQQVIKNNAKKSCNIEHYRRIQQSEFWGYRFINDSEGYTPPPEVSEVSETSKGQPVINGFNYLTLMSADQLKEILQKYISSEIPLICTIDSKALKLGEGSHGILVTGYKTDDRTQNITHVICNLLLPDPTSTYETYKKYLDYLFPGQINNPYDIYKKLFVHGLEDNGKCEMPVDKFLNICNGISCISDISDINDISDVR